MTHSAADRTLSFHRDIAAPVDVVWAAWTDPKGLPQWWGPDGFSCKTKRIDLREGGDWVFDMIGPDGTVYPNHQKFVAMVPGQRIEYLLLMGEDGPEHARATALFEPHGDGTRVTLSMIMATAEAYDGAMAVGAVALGLQTLGKLARHIGAE
jgi:uncharacterized protein YndB with AHSA1/START domain